MCIKMKHTQKKRVVRNEQSIKKPSVLAIIVVSRKPEKENAIINVLPLTP